MGLGFSKGTASLLVRYIYIYMCIIYIYNILLTIILGGIASAIDNIALHPKTLNPEWVWGLYSSLFRTYLVAEGPSVIRHSHDQGFPCARVTLHPKPQAVQSLINLKLKALIIIAI